VIEKIGKVIEIAVIDSETMSSATKLDTKNMSIKLFSAFIRLDKNIGKLNTRMLRYRFLLSNKCCRRIAELARCMM